MHCWESPVKTVLIKHQLDILDALATDGSDAKRGEASIVRLETPFASLRTRPNSQTVEASGPTCDEKRSSALSRLRAAMRRDGSLGSGIPGETHLSLVNRSSYRSCTAKTRSRPPSDRTYNPTVPDRLVFEQAFRRCNSDDVSGAIAN
jgi:hypothetical protein